MPRWPAALGRGPAAAGEAILLHRDQALVARGEAVGTVAEVLVVPIGGELTHVIVRRTAWSSVGGAFVLPVEAIAWVSADALFVDATAAQLARETEGQPPAAPAGPVAFGLA